MTRPAQPARQMPDDFPSLAPLHTSSELRQRYRCKMDTIARWRRECGIPTPAKKAPGHETMPADFPQFAAVSTSAALTKHYNRCAETIARWRRECGVKTPGSAHRSPGSFRMAEAPANFATLAPTMTRRAAQDFFGRTPAVITRWAQEAGIQFRPQISVVSGQRRHKIIDTQRDMTRAGQAAEFLQRFGPVFRCNGTGKPDPRGKLWCRGSSLLTDAEIIQRAERNGWRPDAWKQLSSPHTKGARA